MKKCLLFLLLTISVLMPMTVKADQMFVGGRLYATNAAIGSNVVFSIDRSINARLSGFITYDSNVLEFVETKTECSPRFNDVCFIGGTLNKTVEKGKVAIDYMPDNDEIMLILVNFKVKSYPHGGSTTIKFTSTNGQGTYPESFEMKIGIVPEKQCPACEKDEVNCPVCEVCDNKNETDKDTTDKVDKEDSTNEKTDNKDMLLYGALGGCGVLSIAVILLIAKKN